MPCWNKLAVCLSVCQSAFLSVNYANIIAFTIFSHVVMHLGWNPWLHGSWVDCSPSSKSFRHTAQHNLKAVRNLSRKYQWQREIKTSFYNLTFKGQKFTIKWYSKRLRVSWTVRSDHKNIVNANIQINQDGWTST